MSNVLHLPDLAQLDRWANEDSDPSATTRDAARRLLSIALALAVKHEAISVHYRAWRDGTTGQNALSYVIGETRYEMVPPPLELADALLTAARALLTPRGPWGALRRLLGRAGGGCSGQFSLLDADGGRSE